MLNQSHRTVPRRWALVLALAGLLAACGQEEAAPPAGGGPAAGRPQAGAGQRAGGGAQGQRQRPGRPGSGRPGGPGGGGPQQPRSDAVLVEARPVRLEDIASTYTSTGTLRAEREAMVLSRSRGRVEEVHVEEGDVVEPGTILCRLEDDELRIARDRARATAANARIKFDRAERLKKQSLISSEEYFEAEHNWKVAHSDAERAELELSYATVTSPIPGRIAERQVSAGQEVVAGDALFRVLDEDPLHLDLHVPERLVGRMAVGQAVDLVLDATGRELEGRIGLLAPYVDTSTGTVRVRVDVHSERTVRTGSFARARVVTETHENTPVIPRDALISEGDDWFVFTVVDGAARRVLVRLGFEEAERVELLAGPDPGEMVVVKGASGLQDDMPVEILKAETPGDSGEEPGVDAAG